MRCIVFRFASLLLVITLAGCATLSGAASLPSGDTRHWLTYRVEIGDQVLQFSVPPGVNEDFMDPPVPKRIDLQQPELFDETGSGPTVLSRHWDYRKNMFSPILGTLVAGIGLYYSEQSLGSLTSLKDVVRTHRELIQKQALARDPNDTGPPTPPVRFDSAKIAGKDAWYVSYRMLPSGYVVPLDEHHYLGIGVRNGVNPIDWREDAQAAADAILKSIKIEAK